MQKRVDWVNQKVLKDANIHESFGYLFDICLVFEPHHSFKMDFTFDLNVVLIL